MTKALGHDDGPDRARRFLEKAARPIEPEVDAWKAQVAHAGNVLKEFMANGFTREEAFALVAMMLEAALCPGGDGE